MFIYKISSLLCALFVYNFEIYRRWCQKRRRSERVATIADIYFAATFQLQLFYGFELLDNIKLKQKSFHALKACYARFR